MSASGCSGTGGVARLLSSSKVPGAALCAMSTRKPSLQLAPAAQVTTCLAFAGTGTGLARLPSTRPVSVTYCGSPRAGPGMNLPYGSTAIIGMFTTSWSTSFRPSLAAASCLTSAHVAMPPSAEPSSLPVETGRFAAFSAYWRRNTCSEGCEV